MLQLTLETPLSASRFCRTVLFGCLFAVAVKRRPGASFRRIRTMTSKKNDSDESMIGETLSTFIELSDRSFYKVRYKIVKYVGSGGEGTIYGSVHTCSPLLTFVCWNSPSKVELH